VGAPVAVLFLDLDNFKRVNDLGHEMGGTSCGWPSPAGQDCVRPEDTKSPGVGGDEFTVLLWRALRARTPSAARGYWRAFHTPFEAPGGRDSHEGPASASPRHPGESRNLLRNADLWHGTRKKQSKSRNGYRYTTRSQAWPSSSWSWRVACVGR